MLVDRLSFYTKISTVKHPPSMVTQPAIHYQTETQLLMYWKLVVHLLDGFTSAKFVNEGDKTKTAIISRHWIHHEPQVPDGATFLKQWNQFIFKHFLGNTTTEYLHTTHQSHISLLTRQYQSHHWKDKKHAITNCVVVVKGTVSKLIGIMRHIEMITATFNLPSTFWAGTVVGCLWCAITCHFTSLLSY